MWCLCRRRANKPSSRKPLSSVPSTRVPTKQKMLIPDLPPELWARIVQNLPPATLSSLSQVNTTLHKVCTTAALFQQHLPLFTASPTPQQRFRRLQALSHPPLKHSSTRISSSVRILLAIGDHLLLHDVSSSRIIAFPTGVTVDVVRLVGHPPVTHDGLLTRSVVLPGNNIAFVSCINRVRLAIWNVITGEVVIRHVTGGLRAFCNHIMSGRFAAVAGENAEWLIYYANDHSIVLVDWTTSNLVRDLTAGPTTAIKFVMGECKAIDGMSVVGVMSQNVDGFMRQIVCKCFDGTEATFRTLREKYCVKVLRSVDKRTHIIILSPTLVRFNYEFATPGHTEFLAHRKQAGVITTWDGMLPMYTQAEIRDNGRAIIARCGDRKDTFLDPENAIDPLLWLVLSDDGSTERISMRKRDTWSPPIWLLRTVHEAFAVMVRHELGSVVFIKFVKEGEAFKEIDVKHWSTKERIVDATVVGDHFVVATCQHGRLFVWHFDKFCLGAEGVYACPGLIPEPFAGEGSRCLQRT